MADQSPYLVAALQQLENQPPIQAPQGPNLAAMQKAGQDRKAWEAANPGQSYMAHSLGQIGQNLQAAPGNVLSGFQRLAQGLPGQGGPSMPVDPNAAPWAMNGLPPGLQ